MKDIRNIETDLDFENKIRPQELKTFSGQDKIVDNLTVFIQAALMRGESLDHNLITACWSCLSTFFCGMPNCSAISL